MNEVLGNLTQVHDLRSQWPHEAEHFTPWLAQSESLALLGETLGQSADWLELVGTEQAVGAFSADIVCRDTGGEDEYVVIENQFGPTDHDHLGKLLTYAAGLKAKTLIWVSQKLRDQHRAAIDMLNAATTEDYAFFGLEIELWRIGDSPAAPRFNVVAKPNEWAKATQRSARERSLSVLEKTYQRYWIAFKSVLEEKTKLRTHSVGPRSWLHLPIGRTDFCLSISLNPRTNEVFAKFEVYAQPSLGYFTLLKQDEAAITQELGFSLVWDDVPNGARIQLYTCLSDADPTRETDWQRQHEWLVTKLVKIHEVFHDRVQMLDLADLPEDWA